MLQENYSISYHSYCPYVTIEINERTPKLVREQITSIACDYQKLSLDKAKERQADSALICFSMPSYPMGVSATISQESSPHLVCYHAQSADTIKQFTRIFPNFYVGKTPPELNFCARLSDMLNFYQLKRSEAKQVINSKGELTQLIFTPKKPIKGQRFSQIVIPVALSNFIDSGKTKLTPASIDQAYCGNIIFRY